VKTFSGAGSIKALAREVDAAGVRNLLLVTDPGVVRAGIVERVRDVVGGHIAAVFDAVPQDSGLGVVAGAAAAGRSAGADAVLSVGGGSVIDTGKGVALMLGLDLPATALPGINHLRGRPAFHAVVPTTAGTGSEATDVAVLRDERTTVKVFVVDRLVIPDVAILDPEMTLSLPPALTASTAADALAHGIEAATSRLANPATDIHALEAIRLIAACLPRALADGGDRAAREGLLVTAHLAGHAIAGARVGLVHAMSHALTARYGTPHGMANAVLLPHVMRWNAAAPTTDARFARIATALVPGSDHAEPVAAAGLAAADRVAALLAAAGLPASLRALGVPRRAAAECTPAALADLSLLTNPRRPAGPGDVEALYATAWGA